MDAMLTFSLDNFMIETTQREFAIFFYIQQLLNCIAYHKIVN